MSLQLNCWSDELSPVQLAAFEKAEKEHNEIRNKLNEVIEGSASENIFSGDVFSAYQLTGLVTGLESITKSISAIQNANKKVLKTYSSKSPRYYPSTSSKDDNIEIEDEDDEDYMPLSKRKAAEKKKERKEEKKKRSSLSGSPEKIMSTSTNLRPSENTAIGGLAVGSDLGTFSSSSSKNKKEIVDLTKDDSGKVQADSREITFNKLQGKTFPSLVVVARPSLKVKENTAADRSVLDVKVKSVLMHTATKFTEWLIQQGLVRSEQGCHIHPGSNLKLGMYSDASKFPYSGGYVWISECCPSRFVSVFNGSLFEGSPHPPSVLLKLIYHWSCQTNVQNVIQWVKVDNLYVKGLYTWLRAVCTVALHQHMTLLGGAGKKIEVGVISLGTTTQDGQQRQVKVEVLGIFDPEGKLIRLRAIEPLNESERNYKKRFAKILEPLSGWVHKDSIILTDLTVDKSTLHSMGYKTVHQVTASEATRNSNATIMEYLRRIVPRMFQNTLSLLSRQIIQQFLDELVWREWYGVSPGQAFDNIVSHIAEQTRLDAKDTLVARLNKVASNPFKNWSHLSVKGHVITELIPSSERFGKRLSRKRNSSPPPVVSRPSTSSKKIVPIKETKKEKPKSIPMRKSISETPVEDLISLESYYYGIYDSNENNASSDIVAFEIQCPECDKSFITNTELMDHFFKHVSISENSNQCRYCLDNLSTPDALTKHTMFNHPMETKTIAFAHYCVICESRFSAIALLAKHMYKHHSPSELPYKCGGCDYSCSSHRKTIDHFYDNHGQSAILQCPFCFKIYVAVNRKEGTLHENVVGFLSHLRMHMNKGHSKKCYRCVSSFISKGELKFHQIHSHNSQSSRQKQLSPLCKNVTNIAKPKIKSHVSKDLLNLFKIDEYFDNLTMYVENGRMCLECDTDFDEDSHIVGIIKCQKCRFQSSCLRAIMNHVSLCTANLSEKAPLNIEMHCICGFSSSDGNSLAKHLVACERKSVYPSVEAAQENTVKRNMLDMLGLVRRADEIEYNSDDVGTTDGATASISNLDASLTGADNSTIEAVQSDVNSESQQQQYENQPQEMMETDAQEQGSEMMETDAPEQFNTQLSLDDLAPGSVLPPPETDRTPQLREEYQSLATPQVQAEYEPLQTSDSLPQFESL